MQFKFRFRLFQILQKDIESRGKVVSLILKWCKSNSSKTTLNSQQATETEKEVLLDEGSAARLLNIQKSVIGLERRWHLLFLRSLEWQCLIENLHKRLLTAVSKKFYREAEKRYLNWYFCYRG